MDKLLTVQEIAALLGVAESTIYQWTHQGFIPHVKIGRFVRFRQRQIEKWVEEKSVQGRGTRKIPIQ